MQLGMEIVAIVVALGAALKRGRNYFKVRHIIHMKFQNFVNFLFPNNKLPLSHIVFNIPELLVAFIFIVCAVVSYAFQLSCS